MDKILLAVITASVVVAVPLSSVIMGIRFERPRFMLIKNELGEIFRYALAMFIIIPVTVALIYYFDPANKSTWEALFLISISPVIPGIVAKEREVTTDTYKKLSWYIISLLLSLFVIPISLIVVRNFFNLHFSIGYEEIALKLFLMFILPLMLGFALRHFFSKAASKIADILQTAVKYAGLVLAVSAIAVMIALFNKLTVIDIVSVIGFLVFAVSTGMIVGHRRNRTGYFLARSVMMRLPAPAIVFAQVNDTVREYLPVILLYIIADTIIGKLLEKKALKIRVNNQEAG